MLYEYDFVSFDNKEDQVKVEEPEYESGSAFTKWFIAFIVSLYMVLGPYGFYATVVVGTLLFITMLVLGCATIGLVVAALLTNIFSLDWTVTKHICVIIGASIPFIEYKSIKRILFGP